MRWFDATPRRATPKGHQSFISHTAAQSIKVSYLHRDLSLLRAWRTDDPGLGRVQPQPDLLHPVLQRRQHLAGLPRQPRRCSATRWFGARVVVVVAWLAVIRSRG
jgi:hypothetical protein